VDDLSSAKKRISDDSATSDGDDDARDRIAARNQLTRI
jgi:hypothetical protein